MISNPELIIDRIISGTQTWKRVLQIVAGSLLTALTAQISIPLPFTPVPITGQTFGVLLIGAALGKWRGAISMMLYLTEGAAGLPFFAGGSLGAVHLLGPTAGYLWSYPLAAYLIGWLAEHNWDKHFTTILAAMAMANALILVLGAAWLAYFVGIQNAFIKGILPFLIGDALKISLAAWTLPIAWKWLET